MKDDEPLEYKLGSIDFYGCKLKIDPRVLIPRQETEILVDHITKKLRGNSLWDVCTGSGCIGIALKNKFPHLQVSLSDLSWDALDLAKENAQGLDIEILHGDLLAPFQGRKTDHIVVNPPYISEKEYFTIDPSVRDFEPKMALVGGEKGVEFYERLAADLPPFLNPKAQVFLEIGYNQEEPLNQIFSSQIWKKECLKDWSGKSRFFFLEKQ